MAVGYKLFEMKGEKLYPLFINKNVETKMNEWVKAEYKPTKGYAPRGGWHIGRDVPDAPWLKAYNGTDKGFYKGRSKNFTRVWCEIEYNDNNDYNEEVAKLPKKCFTDKCPENGFYFFREVGKGTWVITSDIKINRIISENERQQIMADKGYNEVEAYAKYKATMEKRMGL